MLLTVQRRRANGLTIQGNYTLSHCIGDGVVSQPGSGGITPGMRAYNRSNCSGDRAHVVNLSTVVESPKFANNTMRLLGSGWQLSGILKLMSGTSFRVSSGIDTTFTGTSDNGRANQVLADAYLPNKNKDGWLNINAFAVPTQATGICSAVTLSCGYGNAAQLRGPGLDQSGSRFDSKVPGSRRSVDRVPRGGVQCAEPRESAESQRRSEQPDIRQIHGSGGSPHHAART